MEKRRFPSSLCCQCGTGNIDVLQVQVHVATMVATFVLLIVLVVLAITTH